jgi:glycosyltransferase involved in cell wall biosynthesis
MTIEQCWHRVPGGTAVATVRTLDELVRLPDISITGVRAFHRGSPVEPPTPSVPIRTFPLPGPVLYDCWARTGRPRVEWLVRSADVVHATTILVPSSRRPLVVTVHDLAFLHEPERYTARGARLFRIGLEAIKRSADLVLCSSNATLDDCERSGISRDRLRLVTLGVRADAPADNGVIDAFRKQHTIAGRYLLFVGTIEPRKNLPALLDAVAILRSQPGYGDVQLVVVGQSGWGDALTPPPAVADAVRLVGRVDEGVLAGLYRDAAVVCYPSLREGFGLPILEAMIHGAPVVTSRGSSTEEVAGGAAILVDPTDRSDIARGIVDAFNQREALATLGRARAAQFTWAETARRTHAAYVEVMR